MQSNVLYIPTERLFGMIVVKQRSRTEIELARKLQRTFDKAKLRMVQKLRAAVSTGSVERAIIVKELDLILNESGQLVYDSVLEAAAGEPGVSEVLRTSSFNASKRTLDRMRGNVLSTLDTAWTTGLGTADAAGLLDEVFVNLTKVEAERIARTEVNSAQSTSRFAKFQAAGVKYKQWWTARDHRVRDSHAALHGVITAIHERFENGLMHPGDKSGPLVEWINCRCRLLPFLMPMTMAPPLGKTWFKKSELISPRKVDVKIPKPKMLSPEELPWRSLPKIPAGGMSKDTLHIALAKARGYTRPPVILSKEKMDDIIESGKAKEIWRGLSRKSHVEDFKHGEYYSGTGINGSGTYTATKKEIAESYSLKGEDTLMRMAVTDEAKGIEWKELKTLIKKGDSRYIKLEKDLRKYAFDPEAISPVMGLTREQALDRADTIKAMLSDPGRYATLAGYDYITVVEADVIIVLNRGKILIQEAVK